MKRARGGGALGSRCETQDVALRRAYFGGLRTPLRLFLPPHLAAAAAQPLPEPARPVGREHREVWQLYVPTLFIPNLLVSSETKGKRGRKGP